MTAFVFATDEMSETFCREIVRIMMAEFGIPEEEAVGRVNRQWRGKHLFGPDHIIYHEDEYYWAHAIYYGRSSRWWTNSRDLKPQPFPANADD